MDDYALSDGGYATAEEAEEAAKIRIAKEYPRGCKFQWEVVRKF